MKRDYHCEFPGCDYKTQEKSQINNHHIKPKELGGSNAKYNRAYLCPTHHTKVYIPEATRGIHTKKGEDSIIISGWLQSTGGRVLEYIDVNEQVQYLFK